MNTLLPNRPSTAAVLLLCLASPLARAVDQLSVRGSVVAAEAVNAAAPMAKKEIDVEFRVITEGGNATAIAAVGEDVADVAFTSRKLSAQENATWVKKSFFQAQLGMQALVVVVPEPVWNSGVRALSQDQLRGIYEGTIKNWKDVGGDDRKIVFYNRDVSGGVWELFMVFLYEDTRKAPMSAGEIIVDAGDLITSLDFNLGSVSVLEFSAFKGGRLHALGIRMPDGSVVEPTPENVAVGRYPMARPLMMITGQKPTGAVRRLVEFMLGPLGQEFVRKAGHIPNAGLVKGKQP